MDYFLKVSFQYFCQDIMDRSD